MKHKWKVLGALAVIPFLTAYAVSKERAVQECVKAELNIDIFVETNPQKYVTYHQKAAEERCRNRV